jgi:hydrogenase/urease accessory protein HupE
VRHFFWLCVLAALVLTAPQARAHRDQMLKLRLREISTGSFDASWERVEGVRDGAAAALILKPFFPEHCQVDLPRVDCGARGLSGRIGFSGLGNMSVVVTLEVAWLAGPPATFTFTATTPDREVSADRVGSFGVLARDYTRLGIAHILSGIDHLLFVLGLLWLVDSLPVLIKTITAFTVAHSITLALATLGGYTLPSRPVESVIALSIALVAVEVVHKRGGKMDFGARFPWLVAFGFGLLHGFGFADALEELRLGAGHQAIALLFFNLGVELGQFAFVLLVLAARKVLARPWPAAQARIAQLLPYAMGSLAMYWCFVRLSGLD